MVFWSRSKVWGASLWESNIGRWHSHHGPKHKFRKRRVQESAMKRVNFQLERASHHQQPLQTHSIKLNKSRKQPEHLKYLHEQGRIHRLEFWGLGTQPERLQYIIATWKQHETNPSSRINHVLEAVTEGLLGLVWLRIIEASSCGVTSGPFPRWPSSLPHQLQLPTSKRTDSWRSRCKLDYLDQCCEADNFVFLNISHPRRECPAILRDCSWLLHNTTACNTERRQISPQNFEENHSTFRLFLLILGFHEEDGQTRRGTIEKVSTSMINLRSKALLLSLLLSFCLVTVSGINHHDVIKRR